jgi:hypothetical protein
MSSPVDDLLNELWGLIGGPVLLRDVWRVGVVVCARCVRPGEGVRPGEFGDYSLCPRCHASVTSKTLAFLVPAKE